MIFPWPGSHPGWRDKWKPLGTLTMTMLTLYRGVTASLSQSQVYKQRSLQGGRSSFLPFIRHHLGTQPRWDSPLSLAWPGSLSFCLSDSLTLLFSLPITEGPPCQDPCGQNRELQCLPAQQAQWTPQRGAGADGRCLGDLGWGDGGEDGGHQRSHPKAPNFPQVAATLHIRLP